MIRARIFYKKCESLKYTGHLDLHRVWERSIRRSNLALAYSQGFHPQPRIQQACPLPLGFTSDFEIIDLWLTEEYQENTIRKLLTPALQTGLDITEIILVPLSDPALQTLVIASDYYCKFIKEAESNIIGEKINTFLSNESVMRERRGKSYDLRLLVRALAYIGLPEPGIEMRLSALPGATGRPEEVLDELAINLNDVQIKRTNLVLKS
jgi:radical SAM-linked protein